jgi:transcriptional regulator GlxA family with amidase domain
MSAPREPLVFAILAVPESTPSTLYGIHDVVGSAGRDWPLITTGQPGPVCIRPIIVSARGERMRIAGETWIEPACSLADCPPPDVVVVPDLAVAPGEELSGRYEAEGRWLRAQSEAGVTLATSCTGALVLAEAGLLDGQEATIHWAYCEAMAARYPRIRVHPNRALVVSGAGQRLVLAGGGSSWHDLALYLVGQFLGIEEAMHVARLHLIDWHQVGQQPYAMLACNRQAGDPVIARCQQWIAEHYDEETPVSAMVQTSGLAERSFKRRFARATGMSPLEYVHTMRLEEAKHLLETGDASVEAIANEVGYEDASFFGRLFRRKVGITPAQYRRRFGELRRALRATRPPVRSAPPAAQLAGSTRQNTALR